MTPPAHASARDDVPRALAWMLVSGLSFALMGAAVKLAGDIPVGVKVFFRNLVTLGIASAACVRSGTNPLAPTPHLKVLLLRAFCGLAGVTCYFVALGGLTLADASLLNKTSPFFATLFAILLLGERPGRGAAAALVTAFLGAVLVIKPVFAYSPGPALAGFASGMFAGAAYAAVRSLKGRVDPTRIIFTFSLVSTLATLPVLIVTRPDPTPGQWLALLGTGICAAGGQYGLTYAYHHARVNRVSVFTYLHVLFALILGLLIWGERPDILSLVGGVLIVAAALLARRAAAPPAGQG